jgi:hypothetical protein
LINLIFEFFSKLNSITISQWNITQ